MENTHTAGLFAISAWILAPPTRVRHGLSSPYTSGCPGCVGCGKHHSPPKPAWDQTVHIIDKAMNNTPLPKVDNRSVWTRIEVNPMP